MLNELMCPITQEPLRDPVVAADGNLYERFAIQGGIYYSSLLWLVFILQHQFCSNPHAACTPIAAWIARQKAAGQAPCSPLTNQPLEHLMLTPVWALRSLVAGAQAAGLLE